jgi:quercetin dioxygenase-like cupin family protein
MRVAVCTLLVVLVAGVSLTPASAQDNMGYSPVAKAKFQHLPALPKCGSISVANGDPTKGAAVILAKVNAGCVVPWHWHTAAEQLMFVSGSAKVDMKDGAPVRLHAGDYVKLPSKNVHQFTCVAACTFFLATDAAFDIHYVDKDGKEIAPEDALKSKAKAPAKKAPAKDDMKGMNM